MRWELKAAIQFSISCLPYGRTIYRRLQDVTGLCRLDIRDQYSMKRSLLRRIIKQGLPIEARVFLEVGTGWYPVLPILLSLLGAKQVITVDLNPWLSARSLLDTVKGFLEIADDVAEDFELPVADVKAQLRAVEALCTHNGQSPAAILETLGIEYRMPCSASATGLEAESVDYIISSNVFEHIPKEAIAEILVESSRIFKPGGTHIHHIDPSDHFHYDKRISSANFLKFSPRSWYFIGGSGLAYHNRLRAIDYVRLFEQHGFEIVHEYSVVDDRALNDIRLGRQKVHAAFAAYSPEELACRIIDVFARRRVPSTRVLQCEACT